MEYYSIPVSAGALGKNDGCEKAPKFISNLLGLSSEEFSVTKGDVEKQQEEIFEQSKPVFEKNEKSLFIGGTHDITASLFRAFSEKHKSPAIIIFDAHADVEPPTSVPSHEDFVRFLIENDFVEPDNVLHIGLRKISDVEMSFIKEKQTNSVFEEDIHKNIEGVKEAIRQYVSKHENIYLSFDIDVLSDKIMRATGYYPEGGLSSEEAKILFSIVFEKAKAVDIVEFNPEKISMEEEKVLKEMFSDFLK